MKKNLFLLIICSMLLFTVSCSDDDGDYTYLSQGKEVTKGVNDKSYGGFYLLNEGGMNANQVSLDFFNYSTGYYAANVYPEINPTVAHELGSIGNDIQVYHDLLYAVINGSNKIEVMEAGTARRVAQIDVPYCRHIAFYGNFAYVSSGNSNGSTEKDDVISKVNLSTFKVVASINAGRSPEGMVILNNKLYVVNSGGFDYANEKGNDKTVSVIDLSTFKEETKIEVNLNPVEIFALGNKVYVASHTVYGSDWVTVVSKGALQVIDTKENNKVSLVKELDAHKPHLVGSKLYYIADPYSGNVRYEILDLTTGAIASKSFVSKETAEQIINPYGILVNPNTLEVYITAAGNYSSAGYLFCIDKEGAVKWKTEAGIIPAHMVFVRK